MKKSDFKVQMGLPAYEVSNVAWHRQGINGLGRQRSAISVVSQADSKSVMAKDKNPNRRQCELFGHSGMKSNNYMNKQSSQPPDFLPFAEQWKNTSCRSYHHYGKNGEGGEEGRRHHLGRNKKPMMMQQHSSFPPGFLLTPYCTAPDRFLARSHLMQVKETPSDLTNGSEWDQLSVSMWKKFMTHQQTEETYKNKMAVWKFLYVYIKTSFPKYGLYLVGSTMSGFGGNCSDVDMCLLVRHCENVQRNEALSYLTDIYQLLHKFDFIMSLELIQAKVPILKFRDSKHGVEVDLNCNNSVGIRNTHLMYCYSQLDWRVKPLVLVVKLWAHWHDINDAKNMTISSYSLTLMVIHFLQCGVKPSVLPCLHTIYQGKFLPSLEIGMIDIHEDLGPYYSKNSMPLGQLLLNFFQYYSTFDFSKYAISVRAGSVVPIELCRQVRTAKNDPHQWKYLCIEEPFDQTNTARSVYDAEAFNRICHIFRQCASILKGSRSLESVFTYLPYS